MKKKIIFLTILLLSITGCGAKQLYVYKKTTEQDVIKYVSNYILEGTGERVEVDITKKQDLSICTGWFDGCVFKQNVKDGHEYEL